MGESFLLAEDEPLTPNIDGVMALEFLEGGPKTRKLAENRRKLDLWTLVFFFVPAPLSAVYRAQFSQNYETVCVGKTNSGIQRTATTW